MLADMQAARDAGAAEPRRVYVPVVRVRGDDAKPDPKPKKNPWDAVLVLALLYAGYRVIRQATATRFER